MKYSELATSFVLFFFLSLVTILEQSGGDRDAEKDQAAAQTLPMFNVMKLITAWQIQ